MNNNITTKPWERQERETPRAFAAFIVYRDLSPEQRSSARVAQAMGKSASNMGLLCTKYDWVSRAAAWDDEQDRIAREIAQKEQAEAIKEMRKRHTRVATKMLKKAEEALEKIPAYEIKPSDISKLVDSGSKLERISRGDVGEVIEERQGEPATPTVTFYLPSNGRDQSDDEE